MEAGAERLPLVTWPHGRAELQVIQRPLLTFIAVSSVPAFSTLAFVGLVAGSVSSTARLADG